jgi:hypothetical protein
MIAVLNTEIIPMDDETDTLSSKVMLKGSVGEIARDYVALTLKLNNAHPEVMEFVQDYLNDIVGMEDSND